MNTRVLECQPDCLEEWMLREICDVLRAGEPVALPTETVYGLAADALNPSACARIFEAKERPFDDPLIVHLPNLDWLGRIGNAEVLVFRLADAFWPGPLTMVLGRKPEVPDMVTGGQETVAVRMSAHPVFRQVIEAFDRPLAAPSANRFGRVSPTLAEHVVEELGGRIPLVVDAGACRHGVESTIVRVDKGRLSILRNGPITAEELAKFAPVNDGRERLLVPGSMESHYAPSTKLVLIGDRVQASGDARRKGLLAFGRVTGEWDRVEQLSETRDVIEAAVNLYAAMRRLDASGLEVIYSDMIPEVGLGTAIMERLRKAAVK